MRLRRVARSAKLIGFLFLPTDLVRSIETNVVDFIIQITPPQMKEHFSSQSRLVCTYVYEQIYIYSPLLQMHNIRTYV